jgi:hypothetical protein
LLSQFSHFGRFTMRWTLTSPKPPAQTEHFQIDTPRALSTVLAHAHPTTTPTMATKKRVEGKRSRVTRRKPRKPLLAPRQANPVRQPPNSTTEKIPDRAPSSRTISPNPPRLYSPPSPLPRPQVTTGAPTPPSHLFRIIRLLSGYEYRATWLCLRRRVEKTLDHGAWNRSTGGGSVAEGLYRSLKGRKASSLQDRELQMLPQLCIVKTNKTHDILRHDRFAGTPGAIHSSTGNLLAGSTACLRLHAPTVWSVVR